MNSRQLYFRLLSYVKPYWKRLGLSILLLALLAATEPIFPALMKPLLDEGFTNRNESFIEWVPILLVGLFVLRGILTFTSSYVSSWVANRIVADLRSEMFRHMLRLPAAFFDQHSSGRLASHIAYDANNVTGAATSALTVITRDTLTIIGLMGWLLWLDWKLTIIIIVIFPFTAIVIRFFNLRLRKVSSQNQKAMATLTHSIEEAASNNRIVKIFCAEEYEANLFDKSNEKQRGLAMRSIVAGSAVTPLVQMLVSLSVAIIISLALNQSTSGTATAGGFMSFLTALLMLLPPIKRLTEITSVIQRGLAAAEMVFSIIDEPTETSKQNTNSSGKLDSEIIFENVNFYYPGSDKSILNSFSLHIPSGQTLAIVGHSGSGKSTLTSILSGFYPVHSGKVCIGGTCYNHENITELRNNITLVSQDVKLFNNTLIHNIAYGDRNPDVEKVNAAIQMSNSAEFIDKLPDGLNTLIGQNGIKLSGGQRQRIAIARAFYKDSPILILDEATSALDSKAEQSIQNALQKLTQNRTTIIIAHRLSTIEMADRIIVMEDGVIAEEGTHHSLIMENGLYSHYYQIQMAEQQPTSN